MKTAKISWMRAVFAARVFSFLLILVIPLVSQETSSNQPELNDSHFHLTNYIQQGTEIHEFLEIMGSKVGRVALFGIPLQQQWSYTSTLMHLCITTHSPTLGSR
jgi:hypothetical protein